MRVSVEFSVPWVHGLQRPRFNEHAYDTQRNRADKAEMAYRYREACRQAGFGSPPMAPHGVPVSVEVTAYRRLPKSRRRGIESEPDVMVPDVDNVAKLALDALLRVAYADDSQVTSVTARKADRTRDAEERTEVRVSWEEDEDRWTATA